MPADTAALSTLRVLADASGKGSCQSLVGRFGVGNSPEGRDTNMHSAPRARARQKGAGSGASGRGSRGCASQVVSRLMAAGAAFPTLWVLADASRKGLCQSFEGNFGAANSPRIEIQICTQRYKHAQCSCGREAEGIRSGSSGSRRPFQSGRPKEGWTASLLCPQTPGERGKSPRPARRPDPFRSRDKEVTHPPFRPVVSCPPKR